jgi:hypothetical protein
MKPFLYISATFLVLSFVCAGVCRQGSISANKRRSRCCLIDGILHKLTTKSVWIYNVQHRLEDFSRFLSVLLSRARRKLNRRVHITSSLISWVSEIHKWTQIKPPGASGTPRVPIKPCWARIQDRSTHSHFLVHLCLIHNVEDLTRWLSTTRDHRQRHHRRLIAIINGMDTPLKDRGTTQWTP